MKLSVVRNIIKGLLTISVIIISVTILTGCSSDADSAGDSQPTPTSIVDHYGRLKVEGNKIVDRYGNPMILRGMSLFWSQIKGKYYNNDCVEWLRDDWKCTVVRAAMGVETADGLPGYLETGDAEYNKITTVINACIELGIYVIVDWHDHHAHENKDAAIEFFQKIATRYGNHNNIIYEIYNEPMQVSWADDVKPYSEDVIAAIRAIDPDNLIIIGTTTWSQDVDVAAANKIEDINSAYSFHYYASSHKQDLRYRAQSALNAGIALFVSEFGVTEYTGDGVIDQTEVNAWFNFMEENQLSWCNWAIGDKNETSAALLPGATQTGGWSDTEISFSGRLVKEKIIVGNDSLFVSLESN